MTTERLLMFLETWHPHGREFGFPIDSGELGAVWGINPKTIERGIAAILASGKLEVWAKARPGLPTIYRWCAP
jgi:hypothetical protein